MCKKIHFIVLLTFILSLQNCKDEPHFERQPVVKENNSTPINEKKENNQTDDREDWQKPELIIQHLGDLSGKTIADIGSGALGYFVFKLIGMTNAGKVIALDIDREAVATLSQLKSALPENQKSRLEVRLTEPTNPKILKGEVDIALIVNTVAYINDRSSYFKRLREKLRSKGEVVIIDFKTKRIPEYVNAPPYNERAYLNTIEEELYEAGFSEVITDDTSLEYQYWIIATKN